MPRLVLALTLAVASLPVPVAAAAPAIHAHRGAHTLDARHVFGEGTLAGLRAAWDPYGAVVELDARLTSDGVAVAMHDAELDRTTACSGRVADRTFAELAACPVDVLGSPGGALGAEPAPCPQPIPSIAEVLAYARDAGASIGLGISEAAEPVMDAVLASGMPPERLVVESFSPGDLDVARARMPGVKTSLLTLRADNARGPATAAAMGYETVSPEWPVDLAYVNEAHNLFLDVAPFTLTDADQVQAASALGVDAVAVDDVAMARSALGLAGIAAPAGASCPSPAPPGAAALPPPGAELLIPGLASDAFTGPRMRLRWRGRGGDDARVAGFLADVRPEGSRDTSAWRALVAGAREREATFTGAPGVTYAVRVSARGASGGYGSYAFGSVTVPLDERARQVTLSRGWRRARGAGAWAGTLARSSSRRARARLRFRGTRLRVVARRSPGAGRLAVTLDGRRRVVTTAGPPAERQVVFDSGRLRARAHRLVLAPAGGRVELDALAPGG
ncbi:MAG TPA: glycerophosphodiester phosphodiesterase family protein [Solirubrobacteraceae bacterium]|nr:glycerophosphodiester phosphodiesterase family protein [Solirubrobacteraceae bacterium]